MADDPRYRNLLKAVSALTESGADRAERLQKIFSLPYDANWKRTFAYAGGAGGKNA
ncbi:MAG: hypothetical protein QM811_27780 [Pirellulales bacterium]